jgi:hypothetical protein
MVSQVSWHGLIDINLRAKGDIRAGWHHLVENARQLEEGSGSVACWSVMVTNMF